MSHPRSSAQQVLAYPLAPARGKSTATDELHGHLTHQMAGQTSILMGVSRRSDGRYAATIDIEIEVCHVSVAMMFSA